MSDALFAVQQAVMNALAASVDLRGLVGNPVRLYDHVPPGAVFPFVIYGATHIMPFDTKIEMGLEQIITLDIWSRYRGGKEVRDIFQTLYGVLHRANLTVSGQVFLSCEFHSADLAIDGDGLTTHGAARFSIITQAS